MVPLTSFKFIFRIQSAVDNAVVHHILGLGRSRRQFNVVQPQRVF